MDTIYGLAIFGVIIFIFYKIFSWIASGIRKGNRGIQNYFSIREAPAPISPLVSFDFDGPRRYLVAYTGDEPLVKGGIFNMNGDHNRLTSYINDLDRHRVASQNAAQGAIDRFQKDHLLLIDQQRQLFRRVFQAKKHVRRFKELEKLRPSLQNLPERLRINIPAAPTYPTPNDIAKKYTLIPQNMGGTIGKAVSTNGGLSNQGNILGLIAVLGISLIRANSNMSKLKRVAEDARGQVSNYAIAMNTTIATLEVSHRELVQVSAKLKMAETDIKAIVEKVSRIPQKVKYLGALTTDVRADVEQLYYLMMYAEQQSRTTL